MEIGFLLSIPSAPPRTPLMDRCNEKQANLRRKVKTISIFTIYVNSIHWTIPKRVNRIRTRKMWFIIHWTPPFSLICKKDLSSSGWVDKKPFKGHQTPLSPHFQPPSQDFPHQRLSCGESLFCQREKLVGKHLPCLTFHRLKSPVWSSLISSQGKGHRSHFIQTTKPFINNHRMHLNL